MIIEFKFKNVLSFKDWTILDFRVDKKEEKKFNGWGSMNIGREKLIKVVSLYGANASGKTNLIKVFEILKSIIFSKKESKDEKINIIPFLFDEISKNKPSEFEILFYYQNVKYKYILKVDANQIHYESLEYYPRRKPTMIFERKTENEISKISFNNFLKIDEIIKKEIEAKCIKNISVFKAYKQTNVSNEIIENALIFFNNIEGINIAFWELFEFINMNLRKGEIVYSENSDDESIVDKFKDEVLFFLKNTDFNISDFIFEEIEASIGNKTEKIKVIKSFIHKIKNESGNIEYKELPLKLQSQGTKKIITFLSLLLKNIKQNNKVILIDEIENSIHPLLLKHFIKKLLEMNNNFQIIFTTHYDPILEWDEIIRKDFVWFTSKREDGTSELYPLTDFKGLSRITSLKKAYNYGNFGAIPNIED
jgi:AAA15 family ATPase/GTPase